MDRKSIKYSILICLHNSAEFLDEQLARIDAQNADLSEVEVLVIDNGSREGVSKQIREAISKCGRLSPRYVFEGQLGAQYARNRGVRESRGEFLLFLDDDALPCAGWLRGMIGCFEEDPARLVQGRITLSYRSEVPQWVSPHLEMLLSKVDLGLGRAAHGPSFVLANMAIPRRAFDAAGLWDVALGRKGNILLSGEDAEFAMRVADTGEFKGYYCGDATVEHVVRANRYEKSYHLTRSYWQGVTAGYLMKARPHTRKYSKGILAQLAIGGACVLLWPTFLVLRDARAFTYKCRALSLVGFAHGLITFRGLQTD